MRYYRKAISVGMKLRGKAFSVPEYREHLRYETQKARRRAYVLGDKSWSWLPELLTMIGIDPEEAIWVGLYGLFEPTMKVSLVTVHTAWKRAAARLHPDRPDGDPAKAARLNELWAKYESAGLKELPAKTIPVTKPAKSITVTVDCEMSPD
jgi:hypothetical protein